MKCCLLVLLRKKKELSRSPRLEEKSKRHSAGLLGTRWKNEFENFKRAELRPVKLIARKARSWLDGCFFRDRIGMLWENESSGDLEDGIKFSRYLTFVTQCRCLDYTCNKLGKVNFFFFSKIVGNVLSYLFTYLLNSMAKIRINIFFETLMRFRLNFILTLLFFFMIQYSWNNIIALKITYITFFRRTKYWNKILLTVFLQFSSFTLFRLFQDFWNFKRLKRETYEAKNSDSQKILFHFNLAQSILCLFSNLTLKPPCGVMDNFCLS